MNDFCVLEEEQGEESVQVAVCLPLRAMVSDRCRGSNRCLKKCCPEGFLVQGASCVCQDSLSDFSLRYGGLLDAWNGYKTHDDEDINVEVGFPRCTFSDYVEIGPDEIGKNSSLFPDGSLWADDAMSLNQYCVDEKVLEQVEGGGEEEEVEDADDEDKGKKEEGRRAGRSLVLVFCQHKNNETNTTSSTWMVRQHTHTGK